MDADKIRLIIRDVKETGEKYGKLVQGRTVTFPEVAEIIRYYEEDGDNEALIAAEEAVEEYKQRLHQAQGAAGGLTKRINKLEEELKQASNIQSNNKRLARITGMAYELVEYCDKDSNRMLDARGDTLADHPLYVRLRAELGIVDGDDNEYS